MREKLPPLVQIILEVVTLRRLLLNRITLMILLILLAALGGTVYINANDGGRIAGEVVTADGDPVVNATVELKRIPLGGGVVKTRTTRTDANGAFAFTNQTDVLEFQLIMEKNEAVVVKERYHLYFYGQNKHVTLIANER